MFNKNHNSGDKTPKQDNQDNPDNKQTAALEEASPAGQSAPAAEKTAPEKIAPAANDEKKS